MPVTVRRVANEADKALALEIYNLVIPDEAVTSEEVVAFEALTLHTAEFLVSVDGEDVGSAVCAVQPQHPAAAFTLVTVLPRARGRGAGSTLYASCLYIARAHDRELLETRVAAEDEASLSFAVRRDFVEQQRDEWLELDLRKHVPQPVALPDVEIVSLADRPDLALGAYDVACESLPDIPGEEDWTPPPRDAWVENSLFRVHTVPSTFLAIAGGDVVGYAKLRVLPKTDVGEHGMTAVKRAWRRRGIAAALKAAQIEWALQNGLVRLRTANELRNAGMRTLNERLGYVPTSGRVTLRGPFGAGASASGPSSDTRL